MTEENVAGTVDMENDVISQWGWITKYCENKGMIESAGFARRIDDIEKHLYGNERTKKWREFVKEYKNQEIDIYLIANRGEFSVPCTRYNFKCEKCEFAKIAGECHEKDSLSNIFGLSLTQFFDSNS